jgi:tetratricopeptide (TPR) repeat protein
MVKQSAREEALGDLTYVIHNSPPDFVLLPEIYTKMGQVQLDLKRDLAARDSFAKARELKPDYWPAYFHWAEYLRRGGQRAKARELVEAGLSYSPGIKPLESLLSDLGGDPTKIKPRTPTPPSANPSN